MNSEEFCNLLKDKGFDFFSGVPCSFLAPIINCLSRGGRFEYIPATREDEALGIAVGVYLGGKNPVVLMQNSGLGNVIDALTSLVILYKIPMLLIMSWRGMKGDDLPEHLLMGKYMFEFLEIMKLPNCVLSETKVAEQIDYLVGKMKRLSVPVVAIVKKGVVE